MSTVHSNSWFNSHPIPLRGGWFMKVLKWLDLHFEECFLTVFLIILTCLITMNVILRYLLSGGIAWSEAVCRYCLVYSTFFTIAHWVRRGSGIAVDLLTQVLPKQIANVFNWIVLTLQVIFFGYLFIASISVFRNTYIAGMRDGTLGFNMAWIYLACCIGFLDALIRSVQVFILKLRGNKDLIKEG